MTPFITNGTTYLIDERDGNLTVGTQRRHIQVYAHDFGVGHVAWNDVIIA